MDYNQRTLKGVVNCTGIGLHSGEKVNIIIRPAGADTGINFVRTDLPGQPKVKVCFDNVSNTTLATTIGSNGCTISTIEHLMAALFGLGIDNAIVEIDGPEVPIMDGSAAPFIFLFNSTGIKEQKKPKRFMIIKKPFFVEDGNRSISIFPSKRLEISFMIDFSHHLLKNQSYKLAFSGKDFIRKISKARTFGFLNEVQMLKDNGLAKGGSLDNAVVIDDYRILNEGGLRYKNEFVRHKILDFIGDLSVLGIPVIGRFVIKKSGHFLNHLMLKKLVPSKKHWKIMSFTSEEECCNNSVIIPAFGALRRPMPA